jgi:serine/threonine protein kinase/tetratricopeptide (TPR) repeat protein
MTNAFQATPRRGPAPGSRIGPYRLEEPLGQGGVALVFRAVHESSGQVVALKTARAASEGLLASIRREVQALERIRHPGVVKILEGGILEGRPWYAMELLEGGTLAVYLRRGGSQLDATTEEVAGSGAVASATVETVLHTSQVMPAQAAAPARASGPAPAAQPGLRSQASRVDLDWFLMLIRRLCEPLAFIHGEGLVHRDLKPSNVFVRTDGTPVLMDFGLVWLLQQEQSTREVLSVDAARGGTIAYMAPEQARGERLDARGDLFSLGCIMYEGLTGRLPYPAKSFPELVAAHGGGPPPLPSSLAEGVPAALDDLVMGLLAPQPRNRIGHASDVAAALADLGGGTGGLAAAGPKARSYLYRPQLVGRGALLEQALAQVARLREGRGGCLFVSGVSGIGKTTFASEVARLAGFKTVRVVTGECAAVGVVEGRGLRRGGPFYPLARLLQAVGDRCVAGGEELTLLMLGERAKLLAATEPSLRHLPGVDRYPEPAEVPAEAARRRLLDALAETLSAFVSERPTLLVLDDLQWADDLTLAFLESLSERYYAANRVLILGTFRSEEIGPEWERVAALPHVVNLRLERLDAGSIGAMASEMLGQRRVNDKLAGFLSTESSGNPFFVAEYLRAAVDAGLLFRDDRGRWQQTGGGLALERLGLPLSLQPLVSRRLESLSAAARSLAEVAAVLGKDVEVEVLCALALAVGAVADEPTFDSALRDLLVRQVLESTWARSVRFVHDKLREIAYQDLTAERRRQVHAAAAALLEQRHSQTGTLDRAYATLAYHFEEAGATAKALEYLDKAGEAAHRMYASQEALRLLGKANALERSAGAGITVPIGRARRERLLGLNALALGNVNGAFTHLTDAARIAGRPWPRSRLALFGRCLLALGQEIWRRWLPWGRVGLRAEGTERDLLLEAARAYERLMVVNFWITGDMPAVALCAVTNVGLAEAAGGASAELALGYATFGAMCAFIPLDGVAQSYCRRAVDVARDRGDEIAETWVLMNVGMVHILAGRWGAMRECLEKIRSTARRMGFNRRWEEATAALATGCFLAGDFAEAARLDDEMAASIERADPQCKCWVSVRQAQIDLIRGDPAAAVAAAHEGERLCEQGLGQPDWIFTLGSLALARLRAGDAAGARQAAERCAEWMSKGSTPVFYNAASYAALVEVYMALFQTAGDAADRRTLEGATRRALKRLGGLARAVAVAAPCALLWRGMAALHLDGRRDRACRLFQDSLERARALAMPYDEAMALAALGEHGRGDRDAAARHLAGAAAILERIGARHDLDRVRRLAG